MLHNLQVRIIQRISVLRTNFANILDGIVSEEADANAIGGKMVRDVYYCVADGCFR